MKIRIVSDLHLEFNNKFRLPTLPDDKNTILILAGDICVIDKINDIKEFISDCCNRFKYVLYVFGNHEYYHDSITRTLDKFREKIFYHNLFTTDCDNIIIDNYNFILNTLWTNFNNDDTLAMFEAENRMNDFRLIRHGTKNEPYKFKFRPYDSFLLHRKYLQFISNKIKENSDKINIVVSHHLPSIKSVDIQKWGINLLNHAYYSDLENFIIEHQPKLWIHGHTHDSFEYDILNTKVICNPKGYAQRFNADGTEIYQNKLFDPCLLLEL